MTQYKSDVLLFMPETAPITNVKVSASNLADELQSDTAPSKEDKPNEEDQKPEINLEKLIDWGKGLLNLNSHEVDNEAESSTPSK